MRNGQLVRCTKIGDFYHWPVKRGRGVDQIHQTATGMQQFSTTLPAIRLKCKISAIRCLPSYIKYQSTCIFEISNS